jgi:hypothetical protein
LSFIKRLLPNAKYWEVVLHKGILTKYKILWSLPVFCIGLKPLYEAKLPVFCIWLKYLYEEQLPSILYWVKVPL